MLKCRLCCKQAYEVVKVFDEIGMKRKIAQIIGTHFWFTPRKTDPADHIICNPCWLKVYNFHKYYESVERAERRLLHDHDCEYEDKPVIARVRSEEIELLDAKTLVYMRLELDENDEILLPLNTPTNAEQASTSSAATQIIQIADETTAMQNMTSAAAAAAAAPPQAQTELPIVIAGAAALPQAHVQTQFNNTLIAVAVPAAQTQYSNSTQAQAQYPAALTVNEVNAVQIPPTCPIAPAALTAPPLYGLNVNLVEPIVAPEPVYELMEVTTNGQVPAVEENSVVIDSDSNDSSVIVHMESKCRVANCGRTFDDERSLNAHVQQVHLAKAYRQFTCSMCPKVYQTRVGLKRHEKTHETSDFLHYCKLCSQGFHSNFLMQQHMRSIHPPVKCTVSSSWENIP